MTILELLHIIEEVSQRNRKRIFSLREIATLGGVTQPAAGMALLRARAKGIVDRVGNVWINSLHPPELPEIAFALTPVSYISFESALYRHGILSQSPRGVLTLATPNRPRKFQTPWGHIHFIHLKPSLFFGYGPDRMAYPEKAWLDLVYIYGRRRGGLHFSETWYLDDLRRGRLQTYVTHFPSWVAQASNHWRGMLAAS